MVILVLCEFVESLGQYQMLFFAKVEHVGAEA